MPLNRRRKLEKWNQQVEATKLRQAKVRSRRRKQAILDKERRARQAHREARKEIRERLKRLDSIKRRVVASLPNALTEAA
jgi:hypothetical protein